MERREVENIPVDKKKGKDQKQEIMHHSKLVTTEQHRLKKNPTKTLLSVNILVLTVLLLFSEILVRIFAPEIFPIGISKNLFRYNVYGDSFGNSKSIETLAVGTKIYTNSNGFRIDPHNDYCHKKTRKVSFLSVIL